MITLEEVSLFYGSARALDRLSLEVGEREVIALLGPSGCGKTSVLRVVLGLVAPDAGIVRLDGEVASTARRVVRPPEERGLAVVFQDLALWPHLSVRGQLEFVLASRGVRRSQRQARIAETLERVGLRGREDRRPGELSGGEKQRVAIARALVVEPRAILLDEPFSNLDVVLKRELMLFVRSLLAEKRTTALYVTHDPREAAALGDRIAVMERGGIVQSGTLAELRVCPATEFVRSVVEEV